MRKPKRHRRPSTVADLETQLERARRREAATTTAARVDLAALDTPDVAHADQWAEFLNRPGKFYVGQLTIPADDEPMGLKIGGTTTFKADDTQLPYLVEVLRQIRGAFGLHCRITLTPAEPAQPEVGQAERTRDFVASRRLAPGNPMDVADRATRVGLTPDRPATADELAAVREMRRRAEARNGFQMPPPNGHHEPVPADREFTREELVEMLPGQTRAELAADLDRRPEDLGGTVHSDQMPEDLAAELGVPVGSLRRIPITGGGHAWAVLPHGGPEPTGRHAAASTESGAR